MWLKTAAAGGQRGRPNAFGRTAFWQRIGEHRLDRDKLPRDRTGQPIHAGIRQPRHAAKDLLHPLGKHLRSADHDHVAPSSTELIPLASLFHEITRGHLGRVSRQLHEQFAVAPHRDPRSSR